MVSNNHGLTKFHVVWAYPLVYYVLFNCIEVFFDKATEFHYKIVDSSYVALCSISGRYLIRYSIPTFPGNPTAITDDPATAMEGVGLVVFMNPAFTHYEYLRQLEPFVQPGLTLVALPGQTGKPKSV